jgi:nitrite reductase (NO-forming)
MYGLILVEPPEGLPPVDREFYVMQGDFYTVGKYREKGLQPFDMQKAIDENATYVVFNGSEGALVGDNALRPRSASGCACTSATADPTWSAASMSSARSSTRSTTRAAPLPGERSDHDGPGGGSAIVEFTVEVPGTYILVDHSIFRAFNKGALGMLKVEGPETRRSTRARRSTRSTSPTRPSRARAVPRGRGGWPRAR